MLSNVHSLFILFEKRKIGRRKQPQIKKRRNWRWQKDMCSKEALFLSQVVPYGQKNTYGPIDNPYGVMATQKTRITLPGLHQDQLQLLADLRQQIAEKSVAHLADGTEVVDIFAHGPLDADGKMVKGGVYE